MIYPFVAALVGVYFESTLPDWLCLAGRKPDLTLSFCIAVSAFHGPYRGAVLGGFAGTVIDAMMGRYVGANALSFACACLVVGWLARDYLRVSPLLGMSCGLIGGAMKHALQAVALRTGGLVVPFTTVLGTVIIGSLWNCLLVPVWLRMVQWFEEKRDAGRK
ncbi:MAG: hypothetical protein ACPLPR_05735 [Bacillota bacterium]